MWRKRERELPKRKNAAAMASGTGSSAAPKGVLFLMEDEK